MTVSVLLLDDKSFSQRPSGHPATQRDAKDFHLEWYSGTGSGGQHRNKHMNSARLRHFPTGVVVTAQCRKRPQSEAAARFEMDVRLDALKDGTDHKDQNKDRSSQIGSGSRADKRRTYRFQDGIVTDHVTGKSAKIDKVMKGGMDRLWSL